MDYLRQLRVKASGASLQIRESRQGTEPSVSLSPRCLQRSGVPPSGLLSLPGHVFPSWAEKVVPSPTPACLARRCPAPGTALHPRIAGGGLTPTTLQRASMAFNADATVCIPSHSLSPTEETATFYCGVTIPAP